ncbi:hypothetical protein ACFL17_02240 [Pseudomonadota bacterium]
MNVLKSLIYFTAFILFLFGIYLIRYFYFVDDLTGHDWVRTSSFPKLSTSEIVNLGTAHKKHDHPNSSYINFSERPPSDTIRIGIFGDSFTQGLETSDGHDYPSLLNKEFQKSGFDNIEVINFGWHGYGVHQSYLIWEYLGRKFGLDYVIFMPFKFHVNRDSTFIYNDRYYGPIHSRFIIKNKDLEFVSVLGKDRQDASRIYYNLITEKRYLMYDTKAPPFLRALIPTGRQLKLNPFYYELDSPLKDEIFRTYSFLFRNLSKKADKIIIIATDDFIHSLKDSYEYNNIYFLKSQAFELARSFPYRAPGNHLSAMGNQLIAKELFSLLTGKEKPILDRMKISKTDYIHNLATPSEYNPLYQYKNISISINNISIANFMIHKKGSPSHALRIKLNFKNPKIASLLQVSGRSIKFIPLSFLLDDKEPVAILFKQNGNQISIPIGEIESKNKIIGQVLIKNENSNLSTSGSGDIIKINKRNRLELYIKSDKIINDIKVAIGNKVILKGKKLKADGEYKVYSLEPVFLKIAQLRSEANQFIDTDHLKNNNGVIDLMLERDNATIETSPTYLKYEIIRFNSKPFEGESTKYQLNM